MAAKLRIKKTKLKGVKQWKGQWSAKGKKFGLVVSQFNEYLTNQLVEGAVDTLLRHGASSKNIHVAYAPGAFEIPLLAKKLISRVKPAAVLTLSVVIRGSTRHFDQVVDQCAKGVRELSMESGVPVILGMISAANVEDAVERVGVKQMNKGREWALSAMEMASLSEELHAKKNA